MPNGGRVIVLNVHAIIGTRQPRLFARGSCAAMTRVIDSMLTVTMVATGMMATMEIVATRIRSLMPVTSKG